MSVGKPFATDFGMSAVGASRHFAAARDLVATGAPRTLVKPATNELDL
jgi:hypothetical protein